MIGENFFRIFGIHNEIRTNKVPESEPIKDVGVTEHVDTDPKEPPKHDEKEMCIGCPKRNTDYCNKCLTVQEIYV